MSEGTAAFILIIYFVVWMGVGVLMDRRGKRAWRGGVRQGAATLGWARHGKTRKDQ
jgi:hypothetical protein